MSRNLVYVNGQNESITFETGPYLIVKIEGLGIPNVDRQEQKAPYQDGTTYIDSILQNRDIVVELAITKPNDFANIALYRRELSQRLCPKYGLGTLTYTDEDNNSYNIRAVVSSMVFPNKDFRDPYMRAMITFTACDPYWNDVTTDSISLPTVTNSAENSINPNPSHGQSIIQKTNGNLFVVYVKSTGYLVSREYTTSWSAESVISTNTVILPGSIPSMVEKSDGSIVLVYIRVTDLYLVSKTYTTSWSAESTINASASALPSIIQKTNGNLFVVYIRGSDSYLVSREYTTSWSAESTINAGNTQRAQVIQKTNGNLFVVYVKSTGYLVSREYTTSWSAESTINAADSESPSVIEQNDGSLYLVYIGSGSSLVSRLYTTSWSPERVLLLNLIETPIVIRYNITSLIISYIKTANGYLVSVTRSVTPVPAVITGDVPAPFLVTFNGPSVNPRIINQNTLEYIRLNTTLAAADHFDVDTTFGNKTVILTQGGIVKNGIAFLDIGSTFFQLERGTNVVYFEDDAVASTATASMEWTERYVGL